MTIVAENPSLEAVVEMIEAAQRAYLMVALAAVAAAAQVPWAVAPTLEAREAEDSKVAVFVAVVRMAGKAAAPAVVCAEARIPAARPRCGT